MILKNFFMNYLPTCFYISFYVSINVQFFFSQISIQSGLGYQLTIILKCLREKSLDSTRVVYTDVFLYNTITDQSDQ